MNRAVQLTAAILLSSSLAVSSAQPGRTQSESVTRSILSLDCADADGKPSNNFERSDRNLSINRQFYQATMRAYPGARITCSLPIPDDPAWQLDSVLLSFGLNDARVRTSPVRLETYFNGQSVGGQSVGTGDLGRIEIPVTSGGSLALEVECDTGGGCRSWLYFTEAEVRYIRSPELGVN